MEPMNISEMVILFLSTPSARRATTQVRGTEIRSEISIHALREEGDQHSGSRRPSLKQFLSTPSARRATVALCHFVLAFRISIHALREEGDPPSSKSGRPSENFYPRPPRGGRLCKRPKKKGSCRISIHALREEGDRFEVVGCTHRPISIHALREEGDASCIFFQQLLDLFLSTPSARRATTSAWCAGAAVRHFYPRPPRGGRPDCYFITGGLKRISIHALHEEGDLQGTFPGQPFTVISIHALREEGDGGLAFAAINDKISIHALREEGDPALYESCLTLDISIHALREEGDRLPRKPSPADCYFYPRPPRGGRPHYMAFGVAHVPISIHALREEGDAATRRRNRKHREFLSTPSARRATQALFVNRLLDLISIHALREEGDLVPPPVVNDPAEFLSTPSARRATSASISSLYSPFDFYPRPPRGGRRLLAGSAFLLRTISIHALREEGDLLTRLPVLLRTISIHALREEGDWQVDGTTGRLENFYPRPPRGGRPAVS